MVSTNTDIALFLPVRESGKLFLFSVSCDCGLRIHVWIVADQALWGGKYQVR